jgi:uncharacterized protein (TIGR02996 family)
MTHDERAFLDAICAQPDDDTARLVFADWLEENGDPDRAEFIRVEIELFHTPPNTEDDERRRRVLLDRKAGLLKRRIKEWLAPFSPWAKESSFERGFVQSLNVSANAFLQSAGQWYELTPLTRVRFTNCSVWDHGLMVWRAETLFGSPHLSRLASMTIEQQGLTAGNLEPLASHPDLSRLRELVLTQNNLTSDGAILLAAMPQLAGLESLDLCGNNINDAGARALAESEHLHRLKELRLSRNPIHDGAWSALAERFGYALMG